MVLFWSCLMMNPITMCFNVFSCYSDLKKKTLKKSHWRQKGVAFLGKSNSWPHHTHNQEAESEVCLLLLLSSFSLLIQSKIPSRELCHPQWADFPTSVIVTKTAPHVHVLSSIFQVILDSTKSTINTNHQSVDCW